VLRSASERFHQVGKPAAADLEVLAVLEYDFARAAEQGTDLGSGVEADEGGAGDAEETGRIEALLQIVEGRVHPVLTGFTDQPGQTAFGSEEQHAGFGNDDMRFAALDQKAGRTLACPDDAGRGGEATSAVERLRQAHTADGFQQVVDGVQLESIDGVLIECGAKMMWGRECGRQAATSMPLQPGI